MTWPAGAAESLYQQGSIPLAMMLEVITPATGEGVAGSVPGWFATSDANLDSFAHILIRDGYRVNLGSAAVIPVSWQYVEGAWSLFVQIPEGRRQAGRLYGALAVKALRRGAMVRLSVGRIGSNRTEYLPLKLGRIYAVRSAGHPRTYRVEVWDIQTAFRSRMTGTSVATQQRAKLFYGTAGAQDNLAAPYTIGAGSVTVASSAGTQDRFTFESGAAGAIRITSDSAGDFFLTYTAVNNATKTISGLSASGKFGTTANDADAGRSCDAVCLLEGHPIDILLKILTSTGDGTNGPFDKYPRSWGLAVPIELISEAAFNQARRILQLSSGNYHWRLLIEQEQADPSTFISQIFNPAGIWLCVRQGQIVCRLARDMHKAGLQRQPEDLFDGDLLEVPVVHWYPTDQPQTYFRALVINGGGDAFTRSSTSTLPVKEEVSYDLTAVLQSIANRDLIATDIANRLGPWAHMLPEYVDVTLRGLRSYAPGDVVSFTSSEAFGRLDGTRDGYRNRPVMVIRSAMDVNSNSTKLTLATLPIDLQEDGGAT